MVLPLVLVGLVVLVTLTVLFVLRFLGPALDFGPFGQPPPSAGLGGAENTYQDSERDSTRSVTLFPIKVQNVPHVSPPLQSSPHTSHTPLARNMDAWKALDPPSFVLEAIQGHLLSFHGRPPLVLPRPSLETRASGPAADSISDSVADLLRKKAI